LAGAAVPVVAVLPLNYSYSGSYSLVAGYNLAGRGLVDLGFGLRGYLNYHPDGITRVLAEPFTPRSAVQHTAALFGEAMEVATPFALIGPLAFLWLRRCGGRAWALRHVLPFLALPALQSFYFSKDLRYYTELLPFLAVAIAAILSGLLERVPRMCTPLLLLLMAGGALTSGLRLRNDALVFERDALPAFHAVEALVRQNPRVLLFVRDERPQMFERLLWFSVEAGSDHIVVARDLGARNEDLIRLYPAYAVFHIAENGVFTSLR